MGTLTSQLIVSLIDRVTGPSRAVAASINNLTAMQTKNSAMMAATSQKLFVAVAAAYGFGKALKAPISAAAGFETAMLNIGQKADLSDSSITALGKRIRTLAPAVNQTAQDMAKGMDALVGFGLDPERAEAMLGPIGRTATAYEASVNDLARAGFSAMDNLKLKTEDFSKALDVMAESGKSGSFELKDMATEFPSLTASAQALGMTGVTAIGRLSAALQIAHKGAANASAAANNTANLMQKIISPQTTGNFKKLGIDIRKELKKTQDSGGDVFEMIADKTMKAVKGDMSKIVDVFSDKQVLEFMRPLIQNLDEYRKIRDKALAASGVVDNDFARRMRTNAAKVAAFKIQVEDLALAVGGALLPGMNALMARLRPIVGGFAKWAEANPKIVSGLTALAGGLLAARIAALALKLGFGWMLGGALAAAKGGLMLLMAPLRLLPKLLGAAGLAMRLFGGAVLAIPGAALLVAIGAAATFIYNNWSGLGKFFTTFFDTLKKNLDGLDGSRFKGLSDAVSSIAKIWGSFTGEISNETWAKKGVAAGNSVAGAIRSIADAIDAVMQKWEAFKGAWNSVQDILNIDAGKAVASGAKSVADKIGLVLPNSDWRKEMRENEQRANANQPVEPPISGSNYDKWTSGTKAVEHLDQSAMAATAGAKTANAYKKNFEAELRGVDPLIAAAIARWSAMLGGFSASPTITPNISSPTGGGSKQSKINSLETKQQAMFSDGYNFSTV